MHLALMMSYFFSLAVTQAAQRVREVMRANENQKKYDKTAKKKRKIEEEKEEGRPEGPDGDDKNSGDNKDSNKGVGSKAKKQKVAQKSKVQVHDDIFDDACAAALKAATVQDSEFPQY